MARRAPIVPARDRIVAAATREFAERGFDGGRIDAIGKAAGVNKALLYYYFPTKQALYRGLVLEHLQAFGQRLVEDEDPARPAAEAIRHIVEALLSLADERPFAPQFIVREILNAWGHLEDEDFPILLSQIRPIVDTVRRGIERGELRPVPPLFVHLHLTMSMNLFLASAGARTRAAKVVGQPDLVPDARAYARFVADLVVRGLAPESQGVAT